MNTSVIKLLSFANLSVISWIIILIPEARTTTNIGFCVIFLVIYLMYYIADVVIEYKIKDKIRAAFTEEMFVQALKEHLDEERFIEHTHGGKNNEIKH